MSFEINGINGNNRPNRPDPIVCPFVKTTFFPKTRCA